MKSSLAFDANERVQAYKKSVSSVHDNVLLFKGFLGPSLKDKPELSSVGARAARAAGVIVDELGKLRCPPGTPNANQFTDMQMSNCMIPGAAVAKRMARAGRREIGQMLTKAKDVLDKKQVSGATRVAALAALATIEAIDANNFDGAGNFSALTLLSVDLVRSVGKDIAEMALNRLERKGKLTKEQKQEISEVVDKLHDVGSSKYTAALLAGIRKRNRKRKLRLETPQMDDADAGAPPDSDRGGLLAKVTFDADSFNTELEAKTEKLLAKYVPDRGRKDFTEFGDELMLKMGIPRSRTAKQMVDDAIAYLEKDGEQRLELISERIDGLDPQADARRRALAAQMRQIVVLSKTEQGKAALRKEISQGIIESLVGAEISMNDDPSLRGAFTFEVHRSGDRGLEGAGAYAWMAAHVDGRIVPAIRMMPDSLLIDNTKMNNEVGQAGDIIGQTVRMIGADDNQISLAIHEIAHAAHYGELLKTVGIDPSASAKPALQQIIAQGENIGDTYIGARFAVDHGIDLDTKWDDIRKMYADEKLRRKNFGYTGMSLEENFGIYTTRTLHNFAVDSDSNALQNLSQFFSPRETSWREQEDVFHKALESVAQNKVRFFGYNTDGVDGFNTVDEVRGILEKALDGQTVEDFMEEGRTALSGVLGFDSMRLQTKGQNFRDILNTLGQSSEYAKTNVWESVAEGITLNKYTKHFPDANVIDDKIIDDMGRMADVIVPQNSAIRSTIMTPEAKAWLKKLQIASRSIPTLPKKESTF